VGIGTTNPLAKLSVGSGSISDPNVPIQINAPTGQIIYFGANKNGSYGALFGHDFSIGGGVVRTVDPLDSVNIVVNNTTLALRAVSNGNIGIGTTNPITKLDTRGALHVGGGSDGIWLGNAGDNTAYDNVKLYYTGFNSGNPRIYLTPRTQPGSGTINTYLHLLSSTGVGSNNMGLLVDGNVGIGTTNPVSGLSVTKSGTLFFADSVWMQPSGNTLITARGASGQDNWMGIGGHYYATSGSANLLLQANFGDLGSVVGHYISSTATGIGSSYFSIGRMIAGGGIGTPAAKQPQLNIDVSGNVGIGTTNPPTKLSIYDTTGSHITLSNSWVSGSHAISFVGGSPTSNGTVAQQTAARIVCVATAPAGKATGDLKFVTNSGDSFVDALYIAPNGNVGIGITNPSNKLNIVSSAGSGTTVAKFTESTSASDTTSFIAIQTGYPQTSETEGLVRLGVLRNGSGNSASMIFETSTGNSTVRRAIMTNGGFASDFILLSTDNNHQIRSYIDAQKYFDVQGGLDRASYNGTSIGLASRPGYGVDLILYLGGKQPLLPSGWTGTISCVGNANAGSLGTIIYLQTSTNGITWTTRAQTANTWNVTLSWTQSTAENVPIFVRFRLLQNSGGNVGEGSCRISDIRITNLFAKPFAFTLANKLISQYSYQNTTVSSDLIDYQISLLGGTGAYASNNIGHGIAFYCPGVSTDSTGSVIAAINSIDEGNQDAQGLSFCTASSTIGSLSEKLRISNSGNIGIGTTNPEAKLDVRGTVKISETQNVPTDTILLSKPGDASRLWTVFNQGTSSYRLGMGAAPYNLQLWYGLNSTASSPGSQILTISPNGKLAINSSSTSTTLHIRQHGDDDGITISHPTRPGTWKWSHSGVNSENFAFKQNNGTSDAVSYVMGRDAHYWSVNNLETFKIVNTSNQSVARSTYPFHAHNSPMEIRLDSYLAGNYLYSHGGHFFMNPFVRGDSNVTVDILTLSNILYNCGVTIFLEIIAASATTTQGCIIDGAAYLQRSEGSTSYNTAVNLTKRHEWNTGIGNGTLSWSGLTLRYTTVSPSYTKYQIRAHVTSHDGAIVTTAF
jgi:hypothetical protein